MNSSNEERQHPATAARLKRAREEGDVAHSDELATAIQMVAGVATLWFCAATIGNGLRKTTIGLWSSSSISASPDAIVQTSQSLLWTTMRLVLPFLISMFVIGTLAHVMQTRFLIKRPKISLSSISPTRWFGSIFSAKGFGQLIIASPKVLVALGVGAASVWSHRESIFMLGGMPTNLLASALLQITATVGISVAVSLLACSIVDYGMQWYGFQQRTRMTDQEMREEIRGQTGDPQIAKVRHQRMREITGEHS
ncbi:EscU/YscU/HrcU family type III secretion system export apparatus switch protein [Mariniblastus fucicola]|uniref:Flagellar biosynthetic protein FlhB n=1 Tax=Mariniblastus fucicola TaxID=980251 RepID=A0A5B9PNQ8_9BACT|nr:EscU/YscU/HrcU family type III secretion system export apparatus switch protein [Mariniblastus fucicola]QEG24181.1 Flagellar biosynthetic protein FlhB [Mariniblastus fucicola]